MRVSIRKIQDHWENHHHAKKGHNDPDHISDGSNIKHDKTVGVQSHQSQACLSAVD
jgi:hypothetical protein